MRISDWSSDVCSSDLLAAQLVRTASGLVAAVAALFARAPHPAHSGALPADVLLLPRRVLQGVLGRSAVVRGRRAALELLGRELLRSEERRVGKECVSTCRSWWWPYHLKKKKHK